MPSKSKRKKDKSQQQQQLQDSAPLMHPSSSSNTNSANPSSYQQQQAVESSSSNAFISPLHSPSHSINRPHIRNYQEQLPNYDVRSFFAQGDASLRPNTGLTNSYDDALFGMALHELLEHLRMANILCALASIVLLLISWLARLVIVTHFGQLILSIYLAVLSLMLLLTECMNLYNVQSMDVWLKENFGMLRHPLGKTAYIFLLSSLCFGIGAIAEGVVGLVYLASATLLFYTWTTNPEFRALFAVDVRVDNDNGALAEVPVSAKWSFYSVSPFSKQSRLNGNEHASLLNSTYQEDF
ncbi:hypothetical protein MPSEU_000187200 [Mayamaea pseudoterrestris]|nr:hypothetical protein MPSEU_000187200 [Mayamaea pseudoterrestris]